MAGSKTSSRMRAAAMGHLQRAASLFAAPFGEAQEDGDGLAFASPAPFSSLRLALEHKPKFLGGILAMQLVALHPARILLERPLTLQYRGAMLKGAAYFSQNGRKKAHGALADRLHKDAALMEALARIDLELMTILPDSQTDAGGVRIVMRPIGGAYVWSFIPPVKYAVPLPPTQATAMAQAIAGLGRHCNALAKQAGNAVT